MDQNPTQIPDDIFWQAFRYVTGELVEAEDVAFEARLENDAVACEAVCEVTKIVYAVSAVPNARSTKPVVKATVLRPAANSGRSLAATIASIACCLLLLIMLGRQSQDVSEVASMSETGSSDAELLLAAWIDSRGPLVEDERGHEDSVAEDLDVPEWMLAGLTLSDVEEVNGTEIPGEHGIPEDSELF